MTNREKRELKAKAQLLEATLRVGASGVSDAFLSSLNEALSRSALVKIKFAAFKEEKKSLAPLIAEKTGSELILRVGNTAVFHRPKPEAQESPVAP